MARYIDADELKEWVENWLYKDRYYHNGKVSKTIPTAELYDILEQMPSADVVEVVRCKDCKWFNRIGCAIRIDDDSDKPEENDYCSFGERKEE